VNGHGSTTTTMNITTPAVASNRTVPLVDGVAFANLAYLMVTDGTHAFIGQVSSGGGTNSLVVTCLQIVGGSAGDTINTGATVTFSGIPGPNGIFVSVQDAPFGAKGDGLASDVAAINSAIQFAAAFGSTMSAIVFFPPGIYLASRTSIRLTSSAPPYTAANVTLLGAGRDVTIIRGDTVNPLPAHTGIIETGTATGVVVSELTIDGQNVANVDLLHLNANYCEVRDVKFYRAGNFGIFLQAAKTLRIINCRFEGSTGTNDNIGGGAGTPMYLIVRDCHYVAGNGGNFIDLQGTGSNIQLLNNEIEASATSSNPGAVILEGFTDSLISGNRIASAIIVRANASTTLARTVTITDNELDLSNLTIGPAAIEILYNGAVGSLIHGGAMIIARNTIRNAPYAGIVLHGQSISTILLSKMDMIIDNHIVNTNVANAGTVQGFDCAGIVIVGHAAGVLVASNVVEDTQPADGVGSATTPCGFSMTAVPPSQATVYNVTFRGNHVRGTTGTGTIDKFYNVRNAANLSTSRAFRFDGGNYIDGGTYPPRATAVALLTLPGGPNTFSYTNNSRSRQALYVSGGAAVQLTQGGTALSFCPPVILVDPDEATQIAYSATPTVAALLLSS
jgi:hypothetical protein